MKSTSLLFGLFLITFTSCQFFYTPQKDVEGIDISGDLYEILEDYEHYYLAKYIKSSLNKSASSFKNLVNFDCGGAAGCYDLGSYILQIMDKVGEDEIVPMTKKFSDKDKAYFISLVEAGLEYGDLNSATRPQAPKPYVQGGSFKAAFPKLSEKLSK